MNAPVTIRNGNCLELFRSVADNSVDLILADQPFGTTQSEWDKIIPQQLLWQEIRRVMRKDRAVLMFAQEMFAAEMMVTFKEHYRFKYIWEKNRVSNPHMAKKRAMRNFEEILVFSTGSLPYFPQKTYGHKPKNYAVKKANSTSVFSLSKQIVTQAGDTSRYPKSIIAFDCVDNDSKGRIHCNQKPVELLQYLIRSHSEPGDTVLDFCMGSGSCGIASIVEKRNFIGFEKNTAIYKLAEDWLSKFDRNNYCLQLPDLINSPLFGVL